MDSENNVSDINIDENNNEDPYQYFTIWTLTVSYTIFLLCIILYKVVPLWLLLFGACLLTSTSIVGTFFHTLANIDFKSKKSSLDRRKIILRDALVHIGPFILFLAIFSFLVPRTYFTTKGWISTNFVGRKYEPLASNYFFLSLIPGIIITIIYLSLHNPNDIYKDDKFGIITSIVLSFAIFCSSYQIYFNWSRVILNF